MSDEQTKETVPQGDKVDKPVEDDKKDTSELDKLKASNDEFEKELIRGRELKAESQKLEAEKMLGGESDAGETPEPPKELTDKEYADKLDRGEVNPLKEDGFD